MKYYEGPERYYILFRKHHESLSFISFSAAVILLFITASCSLVDFSPEEGIRTNPSEVNRIIGEDESV